MFLLALWLTSLAFHFSGIAHAEPASCPFSAGLGDGCPAPNGGTFQIPNFFSGYAQQSGQTWGNKNGNTGCPATTKNCHPLWNVAGVDYPIGHYTPTPDLAEPAKIPASTNCEWRASGYHFNPDMPYVQCGVNPDLPSQVEGYNFGAIGAHGCAAIALPVHYRQPTLIRNNLFSLDDAGCSTRMRARDGILPAIVFSPYGDGDITITQNEFNGKTDNDETGGGSNLTWIDGKTSGTLTVTYNVFYHNPGHVYGAGGSPTSVLSFAYNYYEQVEFRGFQGHAEIQSQNIFSQYSSRYETILSPSDTCVCGETLIYVASAGSNNGGVTIANDVMVQNTVGGGPRGDIKIGGHLVKGLFVVDSIAGGSFTTLAPGVAFNRTNLTLRRNTNNNLGVGGTWTTDCQVNPGSDWCPTANNWTGVKDNTASYPSTQGFQGTGAFSGDPATLAISSLTRSSQPAPPARHYG